MAKHIFIDESPVRFEKLVHHLPSWFKRFLPIGGGQAHDHHGKSMFGFVVFLLSESIIFLSFLFIYITLKNISTEWLPPQVKGPQLTNLVIINSVILVSSSFIIQLAETSLKHHHIQKFRLLWLLTSLMGIYFLLGQAREWKNLDFGLSTGVGGGAFYVLTGFHGLHVLAGVILQLIMLRRSFIQGNYQKGQFGVNTTTLFWHFVDVIWIILFLVIYVY